MLQEVNTKKLIDHLKFCRSGDVLDFMDSFREFASSVIAGDERPRSYEEFIRARVATRGQYCCCTEPAPRLAQDRELIRSIRAAGMRVPLQSWETSYGYEIDGWHRLIIADVLGHDTVTMHRKEASPFVDAFSRQARIILLLAHPDDEIFLWPFLESAYRIVAVVSDEANEARPAWGRRLEAFRAACEAIGKPSHCLGYNSGFYRNPRAGLEFLAGELREAIGGFIVATHNEFGEYGHLDHIFCHRVARATARMTLTTTTRFQRDWLPIAGEPSAPAMSLGGVNRDVKLFDTVKAQYSSRIPWPEDIPVADRTEVVVC